MITVSLPLVTTENYGQNTQTTRSPARPGLSRGPNGLAGLGVRARARGGWRQARPDFASSGQIRSELEGLGSRCVTLGESPGSSVLTFPDVKVKDFRT